MLRNEVAVPTYLRRPNACGVQLHSEGATVHNGGLHVVFNCAAAGASCLQGSDNIHRLFIGDLAEDNMAAVKPTGDDGGNEELRAVAAEGESEKASAVCFPA